MKNLTASLLLFCPALCQAQTGIRYAQNKFRAGDELTKHQIAYKEPGRSGIHVLWDLGETEPTNENYELSYTEDESHKDSLIIGTEHRTMYYYHTTDNSLTLNGFENNTTKVSYDMPEVLLKFPMSYGDSISGCFHGTGTYCDKVALRTFGRYVTKADAAGMLILPDGDTIRNVLRIHTERSVYGEYFHIDSLKTISKHPYSAERIDKQGDKCQTVIRNDVYRWYAQGYRYPILETLQTHTDEDGIENRFTTAFYYPPSEQNNLEYDNENREIQERLILHGGDFRNPLSGKAGFTYNAYISDDGVIRFEYGISSEAEISYAIYTPDGKTLYDSGTKRHAGGVYKEQFNTAGYAKGVYLINIRVNDNRYAEKILLK